MVQLYTDEQKEGFDESSPVVQQSLASRSMKHSVSRSMAIRSRQRISQVLKTSKNDQSLVEQYTKELEDAKHQLKKKQRERELKFPSLEEEVEKLSSFFPAMNMGKCATSNISDPLIDSITRDSSTQLPSLVRIWENVQQERLNAIAFDPIGGTMVTVGNDCIVRVWNPRDNILNVELTGHQGPVESCKFQSLVEKQEMDSIHAYTTFFSTMNDFPKLVTCSRDQSLRMWDIQSGECLQAIQNPHFDYPVDAFLSPHRPDAAQILSLDRIGQLRVWTVVPMKPSKPLVPQISRIEANRATLTWKTPLQNMSAISEYRIVQKEFNGLQQLRSNYFVSISFLLHVYPPIIFFFVSYIQCNVIECFRILY